MKKLSDYGRDDHPAGDPEGAQPAWTVVLHDDCEECGDLRVELTLEEVGRPGSTIDLPALRPETAAALAVQSGWLLSIPRNRLRPTPDSSQ